MLRLTGTWSLAARILGWAALFGATALPALPAAAQQYRVISKACDSCGGSVSINSRIGDTCPHCGVTWGYQKTKVVPGRSPEPVPDTYTVPASVLDYRWCIDCSGRVSASSRPGQRCPHCGVCWSYYDRSYDPAAAASYRRPSYRTPGYNYSSGRSLEDIHRQNTSLGLNIQNQMNHQRLMDLHQRQMTPPPLPSR